MTTGMAEVLGADRQYRIAGGAREAPNGAAAVAWQSNVKSPTYCNNRSAVEEEATAAISSAASREIAVLRLEGDRYDSTRVCIENLYPHVAPGGIVIVDDYYNNWDGCARGQ